jgi:hypothetical protein
MLKTVKNVSPYGNDVIYHRIFIEKFNILFFTPKKDQCEVCEVFKTAEHSDRKN